MSDSAKAHLALFGANLIYGINYSVAKAVMPDFIQPLGFIFIRVIGGVLLFWGLGLYGKSEPIARKHLPRLALCGLFGVALNQLLFFAGLNLTTPINASIIMVSNPILVLIASALMLGERITWVRLLGIGLGLSGALWLILSKSSAGFGAETWQGDLLVLLNATSYGVYLVAVKPLMREYRPLTVIKWVFLFGCLVAAPIGWSQFSQIDWASFPPALFANVAFVVLGTTFLTYLLNVYALQRVSPSVVSAYIYSQPFLAACIALMVGQDALTPQKIGSAALVFVGVYLVSLRR